MIDHTTTAKELDLITGRHIVHTSKYPEGTPTRTQAIEDTQLLRGLSDWHRHQAENPVDWIPASDLPDASIGYTVFTSFSEIRFAAYDDETGDWLDCSTEAVVHGVTHYTDLNLPTD